MILHRYYIISKSALFKLRPHVAYFTFVICSANAKKIIDKNYREMTKLNAMNPTSYAAQGEVVHGAELATVSRLYGCSGDRPSGHQGFDETRVGGVCDLVCRDISRLAESLSEHRRKHPASLCGYL